MYRVYTDGACSSNGRAGARASYAYTFPDSPAESYAEPLPAEEQQTNNTAELVAIYHALGKAKRLGARSVHLYTDSEYARNCICEFSKKWIRNGWKTTTGKTPAHAELVQKILELLKGFESWTITHVPAHSGKTDEHSKWNDVADRLAVKALEVSGPVSITDLADPPARSESLETPPLANCPLRLMGPPVNEDELAQYAKAHMAELCADDEDIVNSGLVQIVRKLLAKKGFDVDKQTVHKRVVYRLTQKAPVRINDE